MLDLDSIYTQPINELTAEMHSCIISNLSHDQKRRSKQVWIPFFILNELLIPNVKKMCEAYYSTLAAGLLVAAKSNIGILTSFRKGLLSIEPAKTANCFKPIFKLTSETQQPTGQRRRKYLPLYDRTSIGIL